MKSTKHIQWLYDALPDLVAKGIVPAEVADKLRQHFGPAEKQDGRNVLITVFGILGAVLIGGGIILLLAHNWEQLGRPMRAGIAFVPLLAAIGLGAWGMFRGRTSAAWAEGMGVFWVLAIGTSISLVAQTYNLGGDFGDFILTWALLALPIVYLLGSSLAAALYWIGVTTWCVNARIVDGFELGFWPLLALAAPHLWTAIRRDRYSARVGWLMAVLAICGAVATGASLADRLEENWVLIFSSYFAVLWLAGRQWFGEAGHWRRQPLQSLGGAGMMILAFTLTFREPWHHLVRSAQWHTPATESGLYWARLGVAALWSVGAMCLWGAAIRRRDIGGIVGGLMPVLAAVGFFWSNNADRDFAMPLFFNVYLFAVGVATIVGGVRERRLGTVNRGMLILAGLILMRFFDWHLDFVVRGLVFVGVGVGFLVTNLWLAKRMKVTP